jgi:CxxC-x17-CxxC domain-containing protein
MSSPFQDITLYDKDTGEPFIFTAKEQAFFAKQGFTHVPTRSPERRKQVREERFAKKPFYYVTCSQCKKVGSVSLEPTHSKKTLCEECFSTAWQAYLTAHPDYAIQYEQAVAAAKPLETS